MGAWLSVALLAVFTVPFSQARTFHSEEWAREHFARAERMREALNGQPAQERTRHDYQRVLNAYRAIYLAAPSSTKADPSVVAVAETMVEMGRRFNDDQILNKAIEQYKFLRREYPGSKYRSDGLFTVGEIYKDDLNDSSAARTTFEEFIARYPHNRLVDDAREAIAEIDREQKKVEAKLAKVEHGSVSQKTKTESGNPGVEGSPSPAPDGVSTSATKRERQSAHLARVTSIRHWSTPDYTRVAIDVEGDVQFSSQRIATPSRIVFDLRDTKLASTLVGKSFDVDDGFLKKVRVSQFTPGRTRVVLEVDSLSDYDAFLLPNPYRLIIDLHGKELHATAPGNKNIRSEVDPAEQDLAAVEDGSTPAEENTPVAEDGAKSSDQVRTPVPTEANEKNESSLLKSSIAKPTLVTKVVVEDESDDSSGSASASARRRPRSGRPVLLSNSDSESGLTREAKPTSSGDRSLIRALGLKIGKIVIDPGHGGHDTGTIGPNGLEEKDLVLDVGRRLGKLLETRLGAEVVYTRKDDTFIPLETRTAIANQARADLFVSIHANSSHDPDARGVETYYLNFTSSPQALEVAARENAVSEKSIFELQDLVKKIALKEKIEESKEFAADVQQSLHTGLAIKSPAIRDRGVKKAPFIVLIGANMPSILAEISFVSNPTDEHRLATSEYRERIAESLYRGIAKYGNGLSGVQLASKMDKDSAQ
jgi:N-acetylmuramoyl-L-alanine amidase